MTQALLNKNAKVYMACRSRQRAEEAIEDLKKQTGNEAIFLELDLASLKSIKDSVETFLRYARWFNHEYLSSGIDNIDQSGEILTRVVQQRVRVS